MNGKSEDPVVLSPQGRMSPLAFSISWDPKEVVSIASEGSASKARASGQQAKASSFPVLRQTASRCGPDERSFFPPQDVDESCVSSISRVSTGTRGGSTNSNLAKYLSGGLSFIQM